MHPLHGTPWNIRTNLILPESRVIGLYATSSFLIVWVIGSIFIYIFVVGSKRRTCVERQCLMACQGHPRSLILAPIKSAYAISYWLSIVTLVLSCPVSKILQVSCWELLHPYCTWIFGVFPLDLIGNVVAPRSEDPKLIIRVINFELFQPTLCPKKNDTDVTHYRFNPPFNSILSQQRLCKNYRNRLMWIESTVCNISVVFLGTQCICPRYINVADGQTDGRLTVAIPR